MHYARTKKVRNHKVNLTGAIWYLLCYCLCATKLPQRSVVLQLVMMHIVSKWRMNFIDSFHLWIDAKVTRQLFQWCVVCNQRSNGNDDVSMMGYCTQRSELRPDLEIIPKWRSFTSGWCFPSFQRWFSTLASYGGFLPHVNIHASDLTIDRFSWSWCDLERWNVFTHKVQDSCPRHCPVASRTLT